MSPLPPAYAHVLSLGVLWTSMHCAAMCGPLLCGLRIGGSAPNTQRGVGQGIRGVLSYQLGRSLTYAWLGGLAGLLGASLSRVFTAAGGFMALAFGAGLIHLALRRPSRLVKLRVRRGPALLQTLIAHAQSQLSPLVFSTHPLRELALGAIFGFLPCMIPAWALGQAALTGSPFHGAMIMLLLVLLTTPVLLVTTQLPRLGAIFPAQLRQAVARFLPALSGLWLVLIGGASLGLFSHAHLGVRFFGHAFVMMLF